MDLPSAFDSDTVYGNLDTLHIAVLGLDDYDYVQNVWADSRYFVR